MQPCVPVLKRPSKRLPQRESKNVTSTPPLPLLSSFTEGAQHSGLPSRSQVRDPDRLEQTQMAGFCIRSHGQCCDAVWCIFRRELILII